VWLAPTIIGIPTIAMWTRYYRHKFAPAARSLVAASL